VIYRGTWPSSFLRGSWVRCTVCAASHFSKFSLAFAICRVLIGGHIEQGSSASYFHSSLFRLLTSVSWKSQHLRVHIMLPRTAHERVEEAKFVSRSPPMSTELSVSQGRRMMLMVSSVQFALATGHVTALLVHLIRAFIGAAGTIDGPSQYLLHSSTPNHVAQVLYITNVRL
jgi:hypothetical protein